MTKVGKSLVLLLLASAVLACAPPVVKRQYVQLDDGKPIDTQFETRVPVEQGAKVQGAETETRVSRSQAGLTTLIANPTVPAVQAKAICEPRAELARQNVDTSPRGGYEPPQNYNTNCRQDYFGNYDCTSSRVSGGFAGGFAQGLANSSRGNRRVAYQAAYKSCLAEYGWRP